MVFGWFKDYNNWSNDNYQEHLYTAGAVLSSAAANYLYNNYGTSNATLPAPTSSRKMFKSSSTATKSSVSVEQSGPVQHMSFPAIWNNTRWMKRLRREGKDNDYDMPWKKYKAESNYHITSPQIDSGGGLAPCTWFGFDLGTSWTSATQAAGYYGILNPFNLNIANNYSDIGRMIQQAGFTSTSNGRLDFDQLLGMVELYNNSNVGVEIEVYHCVRRKDLNVGVSQTEEPAGVLDSFIKECVADDLMELTGATLPAYACALNTYLTPFMSSKFCSRWRIYGKKKARLGPGETLKVDWISPIRGILNTNDLFETPITRAYSRHLLIRFVGQIGMKVVETVETPAHMPVDILAIFHVWGMRRYTPAGVSIVMDTEQQGASRPSVNANENKVMPGNARDAADFDVAE